MFVHGVAVEAVPVSHEEASHHHEKEVSEQSDTGDQRMGVEDSSKKVEEQKEVHVHEDGSTHIHDN